MSPSTFFLQYLPHILVLLVGWKMTVGPGTLFFHRLRYFECFTRPIFDATEYGIKDCQKDNHLTLSGYQIMKIPYVRDCFYALSLPCLFIFFYLSRMTGILMTSSQDFLLLHISLAILYSTCIRLIHTNQSVYGHKPLIIVIASMNFCFVSQIFSARDASSPYVNSIIITFICTLFQAFALSVTSLSDGMNYMCYNHPKAELLTFDGAHAILRSVYSTFNTFLIAVWHYISPVVLTIYFIVLHFYGSVVATYYLRFGAAAASVVSIISTKTILQMRLISCLLPLFSYSKSATAEEQRIENLVSPMGSIAFSTVALPVSQLLLCFAKGRPGSESDWFGRMVSTLLLNGLFISSTSVCTSIVGSSHKF